MNKKDIKLSDFLIDFILERGGAMSVLNGATVIG